MRIQVVLALAVALICSMPVLAQQQSGDSQLQLQGSLRLGAPGKGQDSGSVFVSYGRFFTDRQEAGVSATGYIAGDDLAGFGGPFYRYNFSSGKRVPYVGAAAGATFGDFGAGSTVLTFEAGIRFFINRNSAFSTGAITTYSIDESEFDDGLNVVFGFSYLW